MGFYTSSDSYIDIIDISSDWWYIYPSEKYRSQLGWWHSQLNGKQNMFQSTRKWERFIHRFIIDIMIFACVIEIGMNHMIDMIDIIEAIHVYFLGRLRLLGVLGLSPSKRPRNFGQHSWIPWPNPFKSGIVFGFIDICLIVFKFIDICLLENIHFRSNIDPNRCGSNTVQHRSLE